MTDDKTKQDQANSGQPSSEQQDMSKMGQKGGTATDTLPDMNDLDINTSQNDQDITSDAEESGSNQ